MGKSTNYQTTNYECRCCGKSLPSLKRGTRVFCSQECRYTWRVLQQQKKEIVTRLCLICSKEFQVQGRYRRAKYCSNHCRSKASQQGYEQRAKELLDSSEGNGNFTISVGLESIRRRFSILARDGFRCCYCGRSAREDGVKLMVDHILARANSGTDDPSNLITSCQDCNLGKADLILLTKEGQIPTYLTIESLRKFELRENDAR